MDRFLLSTGLCMDRQVRIDFQCALGPQKNQYSVLDYVLNHRPGVRFIVECDEDQHKFSNYSVGCELRRTSDILASLRTAGCTDKVVLVRFNPDAYTVDGVKQKLPRKERYRRLEQLLRTHEPVADFEAVYMYYDTHDGQLDIMDDPEFDPLMKSMCRVVV